MADAQRIEFQLGPSFQASPSYTNSTLNGSTAGATRAGWIVQAATHNDTITHAGFRQGTTTGTPASNSYKIGLYTVDSSGLPTATDLGGGSPTAATFTPSGANDSTFVWVALTNSVQIARGTIYAIVVENNADSSVNNITVAWRTASGIDYRGHHIPYGLTYASSTWTKSTAPTELIWGVKSSTQTYGYPLSSYPANTTSTSGNRVAFKFTLPAEWGTSYKLAGARMPGRLGAAAGSYKWGLWNGAGTLIAGGATEDSDVARSAGSTGWSDWFFADTTLPTLSFGTTYYFGVESVSTSTVGTISVEFPESGNMTALPLGTNCVLSEWNGSAWSDTATRRPMAALILDDITPPTGGGGLIVHPGMSGGMRA